MTDGPATEQYATQPGSAAPADSPEPVTFKRMFGKLLRVIEIQWQIVGLRLAVTFKHILRAALLTCVAALLLVIGLTFLYVAVFKALLLVMGPIAVCLIFAATHIVAALIILVALQSRPDKKGAATTLPSANPGGRHDA